MVIVLLLNTANVPKQDVRIVRPFNMRANCNENVTYYKFIVCSVRGTETREVAWSLENYCLSAYLLAVVIEKFPSYVFIVGVFVYVGT